MRVVIAVVVSVLLFVAKPGSSADWPMWRHDSSRSGATTHALPDDLSVRWVCRMGPTIPAWPESQPKLQFDRGYEPVCAAGRLVIGSPVDGRVVAIEVATGDIAWTYFTEGPVRFAPAVADGRVFVVSDDGCLHCLSLADGSRHWKLNGGPSPRRIIGNDRLISMWPARGGVVVLDGVAYFSASIWPSMGIFVRAVDAASGEVLWTNSTTGSRFIIHPHGASSFGSISPQGYLAIAGDTLLVPGGRTLPAAFDLKTGELRHFEFGGRGTGGFEVLTSKNWYFVAGNVFRGSDGIGAGRFAARVIGPDGIIGNDGSNIVVTKIGNDVDEKTETDRRGRKKKIITAQSEQVDRFFVEGPSRVFLQAGNRVFTVDGAKIAAYDLSDSRPTREPIWSAEVNGDVWSMIAADDCLFVTTLQGDVSCFSQTSDSPKQSPRVFDVPGNQRAISKLATADASAIAQRQADAISTFAHQAHGYAISLGSPSFPVLSQLLEDTDLHIIVVEADEVAATDFRTKAADDRRFGRRLSVLDASLRTAKLPPYLATLIFGEKPASYDQDEIRELFQVLRPYGGTCCLATDDQQHDRIAALPGDSSLTAASVSRSGDWTVIRRVGALPDSGVWSHQYGDSTNSVVSADARVKPPFGLLWFGGPPNDRVLPRHGHGPSPQVAGGRLFIEGLDMLRCVDVYNGRVWWERELPGLGEYYNNTSHHPGAGEIGSNYVSLEDSVYVVYGDQLLELDAETGETTRDFELNSGEATTWGSLLVDGDVLFATANPVSVARSGDQSKAAEIPDNSKVLIPPNAEWQYLAGKDPKGQWTTLGFEPSDWKSGKAGFGYGDDDDRTVLKDMSGRYQRVYIRREFEIDDAAANGDVHLAINFDDAFIAYMNGHEVQRVNVQSGAAAKAKDIKSHEASGTELFQVRDASRWLKKGRNVLAIEGHNASIGSSDFSLDPYLLTVPRSTPASPEPTTRRRGLSDALESTKYSSASRMLVAFERKTGRQLWSTTARFNFRHNAMCAANGRLFCIDALSHEKLAALKRRGIEPQGQSRLSALDARSGREVWSTQEDVFGTFLSFSREHGILLQGGSAYRDRAKDEVGKGLVAYRGTSGEVVWKDLAIGYGGPCLLRHDRIITNGGGGFELDLHTGKRTGWTYSRMYGCNTAIGSEHLLTFRSGAAGFCDLFSDSGTGNLGGFRSSCTANLVVADGVLNAPDYTRTCSCAYQLQTSLAMVHDPDAEFWAFGHTDFTSRPVSSIGINLGAPGDRRDASGTLWFDYPSQGGPSPKLDVQIEPTTAKRFSRHSSLMAREDLNWVGASGLRGVRRLRLQSKVPQETETALVRLVFAEPDGRKPGERVFTVRINGREVLPMLDIAAAAGGSNRTLIRDVEVPGFDGTLELELVPESRSVEPVISGVSFRTK